MQDSSDGPYVAVKQGKGVSSLPVAKRMSYRELLGRLISSFDTLRTLECPACLPAEDAVDVRYLPIHPLSPIQQDRLSSGDGIVLRMIHADPPRTGAVGEIAVRDVG